MSSFTLPPIKGASNSKIKPTTLIGQQEESQTLPLMAFNNSVGILKDDKAE